MVAYGTTHTRAKSYPLHLTKILAPNGKPALKTPYCPYTKNFFDPTQKLTKINHFKKS